MVIDGGCSFWQPVQADSQSSGLVFGRRPLGANLHSSNEPGELSQWLCHNDSTINIVVVIITVIIIEISALFCQLRAYMTVIWGNFHHQAECGWFCRSRHIWKLIMQLGRPQPAFTNRTETSRYIRDITGLRLHV